MELATERRVVSPATFRARPLRALRFAHADNTFTSCADELVALHEPGHVHRLARSRLALEGSLPRRAGIRRASSRSDVRMNRRSPILTLARRGASGGPS